MALYTKKIKSLQHPTVKHLVKLRKERQYRLEKESLLLEGKKIISEYRGLIKTLLITEEAVIPSHLKPKQTLLISTEIMKKISAVKSPEPYLAEVILPSLSTLEGKKRLLALDTVNDPGNVGTLIRSALSFGFDGVFLTHDSADPFMNKTLRAAKGATFYLPLQVGTRDELIALIKKNKLTSYIADRKGSCYAKAKITAPLILILGNEANGPSGSLKALGELISIPIRGEVESLNVAIAGAILMNKFQEVLWPI